jgi:uncharacterized membrane protein YcaP (DUF421 family)
MKLLDTFWGHGEDLDSLQMVSRAVLCFFVTLGLIRVAGIRTFGKKTPFDTVVAIMLGSIYSRVVVGASPFVATTLGCLAFVLVHRLLALVTVYSDTIGRWVKGEPTVLYADGQRNLQNMRRARISEKDLLESVRLQLHQDDLEEVKEIIMERTGDISVIKK